MRVSVILSRKGDDVATISPDATLADATARLAERGVGALVVSASGTTVDGILSERDIVRRLARDAEETLHLRVRDAMTAQVTTCGRDTTVDELMATMTTRRIRHVPVVEEGRLAGIVSIGDVVKSRIDELEIEREALHDYVTGSGY